jgi:hypothetical protein
MSNSFTSVKVQCQQLINLCDDNERLIKEISELRLALTTEQNKQGECQEQLKVISSHLQKQMEITFNSSKRCESLENSYTILKNEYDSYRLNQEQKYSELLVKYSELENAMKESKKNAQLDRPINEFTQELKSLSLPIETEFVISFIKNMKDDTLNITACRLFNAFTQFLQKRSTVENKINISNIKFGISIKKLNITGWEHIRERVVRYRIDRKLSLLWLKDKQYIDYETYTKHIADDDENTGDDSLNN